MHPHAALVRDPHERLLVQQLDSRHTTKRSSSPILKRRRQPDPNGRLANMLQFSIPRSDERARQRGTRPDGLPWAALLVLAATGLSMIMTETLPAGYRRLRTDSTPLRRQPASSSLRTRSER